MALRGAGIDCLLLKGIGYELWLYPDGGRPLSRDVDLLVGPTQLSAAGAVVAQLGMRVHRHPLGPPMDGAHLRFVPSDRAGMPVELHTTFHFLTASEERCWTVLSTDRDWIEVGATRIDVPAVPVRALLLALHVTAHGRAGTWAIEDLRRAIGLLPLDDWRQAAALAKQLGASTAFSAGLRVLPAGAEIADMLGLAKPDDPALLLSLQSASLPAYRMLRYAGGFPVSAFARLLGSQLFPPSDQMRTWYPIARRGRRGLVTAHAARLVRLALQTSQLVADWHQAREVVRRHGSPHTGRVEQPVAAAPPAAGRGRACEASRPTPTELATQAQARGSVKRSEPSEQSVRRLRESGE